MLIALAACKRVNLWILIGIGVRLHIGKHRILVIVQNRGVDQVDLGLLCTNVEDRGVPCTRTGHSEHFDDRHVVQRILGTVDLIRVVQTLICGAVFENAIIACGGSVLVNDRAVLDVDRKRISRTEECTSCSEDQRVTVQVKPEALQIQTGIFLIFTVCVRIEVGIVRCLGFCTAGNVACRIFLCVAIGIVGDHLNHTAGILPLGSGLIGGVDGSSAGVGDLDAVGIDGDCNSAELRKVFVRLKTGGVSRCTLFKNPGAFFDLGFSSLVGEELFASCAAPVCTVTGSKEGRGNRSVSLEFFVIAQHRDHEIFIGGLVAFCVPVSIAGLTNGMRCQTVLCLGRTKAGLLFFNMHMRFIKVEQ